MWHSLTKLPSFPIGNPLKKCNLVTKLPNNIILLPGHSMLQDWVSLPSLALHAVPPFDAAVLLLVLVWSPVPSAALQSVPQLDQASQLPHWQFTEKAQFTHQVTKTKNLITWTFSTARLGVIPISRIACSTISSCYARSCSGLITCTISCTAGCSATWPCFPASPLAIHWKNVI